MYTGGYVNGGGIKYTGILLYRIDFLSNMERFLWDQRRLIW